MNNLSNSKNPHRYDKLIYNNRPQPKKPMDNSHRAAQFSSFAALTGYDDQVKETARLTEDEIDYADNMISHIDLKLRFLREHLFSRPSVRIKYYVPDTESHVNSKKTGGSYEFHEGIVKKIDTYDQTIIFFDNKKIQIKQILDLDGDIFAQITDNFYY